MGIIYFKSDTCDLVLTCDNLQIIMLCTGYVIQAYFTLTFLTKYIVIFRIWMDNWGILFANLEQVQKQTSRGVLTKGCSETMQQIEKKEKKHLCRSQFYWNHTSVWVFSCKFAAYLHITVSNDNSGGLLLYQARKTLLWVTQDKNAVLNTPSLKLY